MNEQQVELMLRRLGAINQSLQVIAVAHAMAIGAMVIIALAWILS